MSKPEEEVNKKANRGVRGEMRSMRTQQERRRFKEVRVRRNKEALLKIHMKKIERVGVNMNVT